MPQLSLVSQWPLASLVFLRLLPSLHAQKLPSLSHWPLSSLRTQLPSFLSFLRFLTQTLIYSLSLSSDSILSFITSNSISCCGLNAVRGETGCATTGATGTTGNKILTNAFCISTLLIPLGSISLPAS